MTFVILLTLYHNYTTHPTFSSLQCGSFCNALSWAFPRPYRFWFRSSSVRWKGLALKAEARATQPSSLNLQFATLQEENPVIPCQIKNDCIKLFSIKPTSALAKAKPCTPTSVSPVYTVYSSIQLRVAVLLNHIGCCHSGSGFSDYRCLSWEQWPVLHSNSQWGDSYPDWRGNQKHWNLGYKL